MENKKKIKRRYYEILGGDNGYEDYNEDGNIVFKKSNTTNMEELYQYNDNGKIKYYREIKPNTDIKIELFYEYDKNNRLIKTHSEYQSVTTEFTDIWYEYNNEGLLSKMIYDTGAITIFEYDNRGNLKYTKMIDSDSHEFEFWYTYDENNNLISRKVDELHEETYEYDSNNNMVKMISSGFEETYEYDEYNNLITVRSDIGITEKYRYEFY